MSEIQSAYDLAMAALQERVQVGIERYGSELTTATEPERDWFEEALQEAADTLLYLVVERERRRKEEKE